MCKRLLVFVLACTCSVFFNAGQSSENSSQRVLMVLVLFRCLNGCESEARATQVDDRKPGMEIWLDLGVVPPPTPTGPVKRDWYMLMGAFASAFTRLRVWGIASPLKVEEPWWEQSRSGGG